jgi:hypothetical protein
MDADAPSHRIRLYFSPPAVLHVSKLSGNTGYPRLGSTPRLSPSGYLFRRRWMESRQGRAVKHLMLTIMLQPMLPSPLYQLHNVMLTTPWSHRRYRRRHGGVLGGWNKPGRREQVLERVALLKFNVFLLTRRLLIKGAALFQALLSLFSSRPILCRY